jgi:hypothetical protein
LITSISVINERAIDHFLGMINERAIDLFLVIKGQVCTKFLKKIFPITCSTYGLCPL